VTIRKKSDAEERAFIRSHTLVLVLSVIVAFFCFSLLSVKGAGVTR
jgi:hypothetical protein